MKKINKKISIVALCVIMLISMFSVLGFAVQSGDYTLNFICKTSDSKITFKDEEINIYKIPETVTKTEDAEKYITDNKTPVLTSLKTGEAGIATVKLSPDNYYIKLSSVKIENKEYLPESFVINLNDSVNSFPAEINCYIKYKVVDISVDPIKPTNPVNPTTPEKPTQPTSTEKPTDPTTAAPTVPTVPTRPTTTRQTVITEPDEPTTSGRTVPFTGSSAPIAAAAAFLIAGVAAVVCLRKKEDNDEA